MPIGDKNKRVNNVDCPRHAFAYAPDELDTSTWMLPVYIPGDVQKTLNAVKTSLYRFDTAKIPDGDRQQVFDILLGALRSHGIDTARRTFAPTNEAPTPAAEPAPPAKVEVKAKPVKKDPKVEAIFAEADWRATALLRSLGYE
jgi:hypothetical protein